MSNTQSVLSPKVTIITVVFNAAQEIEPTLRSVFEQNYIGKEVIIIDGGSTDETVEIINTFKQKIDYFVTEQDLGIYDAMNKGIRVASGDWICFMNAGDRFNSPEVLHDLFCQRNPTSDILVGECMVDYKSFIKRVIVKKSGFLKYGMTFCHQSAFVKTELYREKFFDLRFKIAADYNFFMWCLSTGKKFKIYDFPFSVISVDGVSDKMRNKVLIENRQVLRENSRSNMRVETVYIFKILWTSVKAIIKKILPTALVLRGKKYG